MLGLSRLKLLPACMPGSCWAVSVPGSYRTGLEPGLNTVTGGSPTAHSLSADTAVLTRSCLAEQVLLLPAALCLGGR
jgi:hypothetical protein